MKPSTRLGGLLAVGVVLCGLIYGAVKAVYVLGQVLAVPPALTNLLPLGVLAIAWFVAMRLLKYFQRTGSQDLPSYDVEEKRREVWLQVRSQGKRRYVWRTGVLRWGIGVFLIWTPLMLVFGPRTHTLSRIEIAAVTVMSFFVWTVGGYVFGKWMWRSLEDKYR